MITAAYALIRDADGRLLLVANDYSASGHGIRWGLPGGGIEPGESLAECAVRECREEVGVTVDLGRYVGIIERRTPTFHIQAHHYEATIVGHGPRVIPGEEHVIDFAWLAANELRTHPGTVLGRRCLLEYLAAPEAFPPHTLLAPGEE